MTNATGMDTATPAWVPRPDGDRPRVGAGGEPRDVGSDRERGRRIPGRRSASQPRAGLTDLRAQERTGRLLGHRVKHRMKQNWIKMHDKAGRVLRMETVINAPEEFRVRRRARRRGRRQTEWSP